VADASGDEDDGFDETWELWDECLPDDEIGRLLGGVPEGVSVVFISDSCHSGTGFKLRGPDLHSEVPDPPGMVPKRLGRVFPSRFLALSACPDEGEAADLDGGVLTTALLTTWDQHPDATWAELVDQACARVRANVRQEPRLSATDGGIALLSAPAFRAAS
jgi:hypothetical protein